MLGPDEARFGDVMFNGQEGDIVRSARLGRVRLGGLLRFGDKVVPYARVGIGVQGVSYDSEFVMNGTAMDGPNSSLDITAFFTVGWWTPLPTPP